MSDLICASSASSRRLRSSADIRPPERAQHVHRRRPPTTPKMAPKRSLILAWTQWSPLEGRTASRMALMIVPRACIARPAQQRGGERDEAAVLSDEDGEVKGLDVDRGHVANEDVMLGRLGRSMNERSMVGMRRVRSRDEMGARRHLDGAAPTDRSRRG